jgi:hypothetical protein
MEPTNGDITAKLTGMFLQLGDAEVIELIESPAALAGKIAEAVELLRSFNST